MYSCTSNDYCLSYVSDMIAASTCDLLFNCFFGNKHISYKKIMQLYFLSLYMSIESIQQYI